MENKRIFNIDKSKAGIIGALAGAVISTQFQNKNDHPVKNATKTGIFAALGYMLGNFLEKLLRKYRKD